MNKVINKKGFTLIELIVSLAILAVLLTVVFSFFAFASRTLDRGQRQADLQDDMRNCAKRVTEVLRNAATLDVMASVPGTFDSSKKYIYVKNNIVKLRIGTLETDLLNGSFYGSNITAKFMTQAANSQVLNFQLAGALSDRDFTNSSDVLIQNMGTGTITGLTPGTQGLCISFGPITNTEAVETSKDDLDLAAINSLTDDKVYTTTLMFPATGENGTTITYDTHGSPYISNSGVVTRPGTDFTGPSGEDYATVTVTASISRTDSVSGVTVTETKDFILKVMKLMPMEFTLPATLPDAIYYQTYSYQMNATEGYGLFNYTIISGAIPTGMTLASSTGLLSGTPTQFGNFTFSVKATDVNNNEAGGTKEITSTTQLTVNMQQLQIGQLNPPKGTQGKAYSYQLTASGGDLNYTFSTASSLPSGLTMTSGGLISGTPTSTGTYSFSVTVNDGAGSTPSSYTYTLQIVPPLSITSPSLLTGSKKSTFSYTLQATGGDGNYTFSIQSGTLPGALSLSSAGVISGNTDNNPQDKTVVIKVIDGIGNQVTKSIQIQLS